MLYLGSIQLLILFGVFLVKMGFAASSAGLNLNDFLESVIILGQMKIPTASLLMFCGSLILVAWKTGKQIIEQERIWNG